MLSKIKIPDQLSINAACFSEDNKKLYGFSEYYNELFEIDMEKQDTISLGRLGNEPDLVHMFYELVWCCKKILCIPRNAECIYIYDLANKSQIAFPKNQLGDGFEIDGSSFVSIKFGKYIYLVYVKYMYVYKVDMEKCTITKVTNPYEKQNVKIEMTAANSGVFIIHSTENNRTFSFTMESEKVEEINLDMKHPNCERLYFDGQYIWFYCADEGIVYLHDTTGKKIENYDLQTVNEKPICFLQDQEIIYLILQKMYFSFCNGKIDKKLYSSHMKDKLYYNLPFDSAFFRSYDPEVYGMAPSCVNYLKLDIKTMNFERMIIPFPNSSNQRCIEERIWKVFKPKYSYIQEEKSNDFMFFLKILLGTNNCLENKRECGNIGKQICLQTIHSK